MIQLSKYMTKWKTLSMWVKGGLIFLVVEFVLTILTLITDTKDGSLWGWLLLFTQFPFAFGALFFGGYLPVAIGFLEQHVLYFAAGAFFGWIYGKFKRTPVTH